MANTFLTEPYLQPRGYPIPPVQLEESGASASCRDRASKFARACESLAEPVPGAEGTGVVSGDKGGGSWEEEGLQFKSSLGNLVSPRELGSQLSGKTLALA